MKRIVSGLLLLALLSGCTSAAMQKTPEDSGRDAPLTVVQESMPEDFAVRFTWWYDTDRKSIMDTQEGLLQRDLVTEGTACGVSTGYSVFAGAVCACLRGWIPGYSAANDLAGADNR